MSRIFGIPQSMIIVPCTTTKETIVVVHKNKVRVMKFERRRSANALLHTSYPTVCHVWYTRWDYANEYCYKTVIDTIDFLQHNNYIVKKWFWYQRCSIDCMVANGIAYCGEIEDNCPCFWTWLPARRYYSKWNATRNCNVMLMMKISSILKTDSTSPAINYVCTAD